MRRCFVPLLPFLVCPSIYADDANWIGAGDGLTWEDASNWAWNVEADPSIVDYPGSATSPGNINIRIAAPNGSDLKASLSEALNTATVLRDLRFDAGQGPSTLEVDLLTDSEIIATEVGNTLLTINEGGANGAESIAKLNIAGSLTIGQIRMSRDADGPTSEINILPGGNLFMTGGGHFVMRKEVATGTSILRMSGGTFASGGSRNLEMGSHNSQVHFSGDAIFDGANLTLQSHISGDSHTDKTSLVSVTGSQVQSIRFKAIQGWSSASNTDGSSTFEFITDGGGVTPFVVFGDTDLEGDSGAGDKAADLVVDLTDFPGTSDLVLFDLSGGAGTVIGEFGNITLTSGTGDIDYAYNGGTQIALTNIVKTAGPTPAGLVITSVIANGDDVVLTWNDASPNTYTLESTIDLAATDWTLVTADAVNGTYTDAGALISEQKRFYRLRENR